MLIIAGVTLNTIFLVREIRLNEQHDRFINAVTHELKTPVASIRLYLETLQKREIDDTTRKEFYDIMLADSQRLTSTIDQVLRAGQAKNSKANRIPLDLGELVRECVELARVRHHLPADAIQYEGVRVTVRGDVDELRAAVSNLLDNAIKYSRDEVKVVATVAKSDEVTATVKVRDQGVGIPRNELKRVFKRFYRIPGVVAVRVKGTGLGLYIVQSAAGKHGGRAYAESEGPGKGSTFTLELPIPAGS
jgi:signal transduction histidine kinase